MERDLTSADRPISTLTGDALVEIAPDATLRDVASLLVDADVGALVVTGAGGPAGIVSERDVVRAVAAGKDLGAIACSTVAATDLVRCDAHATVGEVATLMMERWVRHVLVERDGATVGIVSARDLLGIVSGDTEADTADS
ncbi:CBS domain-containing protein [Iamia sp. SCSIO 61187]|uniref:CBS domain-containing protein n=1 Tax=Iamia sp. SCSIO 61187 TaxID=2722752 RepID=UPI001C633E99|nr:CBS domain-containing protein [Iamia sp. SCSIO 61187]QYG94915.1 CBS domain-containing protein [Iamia sp. SCSIO 61187]